MKDPYPVQVYVDVEDLPPPGVTLMHPFDDTDDNSLLKSDEAEPLLSVPKMEAEGTVSDDLLTAGGGSWELLRRSRKGATSPSPALLAHADLGTMQPRGKSPDFPVELRASGSPPSGIKGLPTVHCPTTPESKWAHQSRRTLCNLVANTIGSRWRTNNIKVDEEGSRDKYRIGKTVKLDDLGEGTILDVFAFRKNAVVFLIRGSHVRTLLGIAFASAPKDATELNRIDEERYIRAQRRIEERRGNSSVTTVFRDWVGLVASFWIRKGVCKMMHVRQENLKE
ncbi:hypothetical protein NLI96_g3243 [Meripilus lineatus]|uniref:Uncharacterized protein n=1 Tax=Meripilus lineatus TaxID=2056292 RepID=A0AAD5YL50_9APHY|nr:hypothetical protein NLI96_g3243 [Physisporinus lineatus]